MRLQAGRILAGFVLSGCLWAQGLIQVHGYIQGRFTDQNGVVDRLELRRVRVRLNGDPLPGTSYLFQVDLAKTPYLMDAALAHQFSRAFSVSAGQMKLPFSVESIVADNLNPPISRSRAVLALAPGRDTGVQGRDTGAQVAGGLFRGNDHVLEYAAGVFRGQTFINSPNIHYNAAAGRVVGHIHGLSAGGSWYGSFSAPPGLVKRREGIEAEYELGRTHLRAEQIFARDGTRKRRGGYLLGAWQLTPNWETLARADWLTTNVNKPNSSSIAYIAGVNRWLWGHVKVSFNAGAQHDQGPNGWSRVILAQIMPFF